MSSAATGLKRSLLYAPAANARALEKARELPADAIIIDLEDSVGAEAKDQARAFTAGAYSRLRLSVAALDIEELPWQPSSNRGQVTS